MTRRPRRSPTEPVADLGPRVRLDRGEVAIADEPDETAPNRSIRRTRVYDPLRHMDRLDTGLFLAAERFRQRYALAEGAREHDGTSHREPWQRCLYSAKVADARAEVRGSIQAVGLRLSAVFVAAVILQDKLRDIERDLTIRNGDAGRMVIEALVLLRDYQTELGG